MIIPLISKIWSYINHNQTIQLLLPQYRLSYSLASVSARHPVWLAATLAVVDQLRRDCRRLQEVWELCFPVLDIVRTPVWCPGPMPVKPRLVIILFEREELLFEKALNEGEGITIVVPLRSELIFLSWAARAISWYYPLAYRCFSSWVLTFL